MKVRVLLYLLLTCLFSPFQFDEQQEIEFRMPSRYSQSYYDDSTLDSPTVRSSSSTQHVDDENVVVADRTSEVK